MQLLMPGSCACIAKLAAAAEFSTLEKISTLSPLAEFSSCGARGVPKGIKSRTRSDCAHSSIVSKETSEI